MIEAIRMVNMRVFKMANVKIEVFIVISMESTFLWPVGSKVVPIMHIIFIIVINIM